MTDIEKLGAHEIAAWLRRHPEFLRQFPDLAGSLVVPRETGPAASLASYQLEVLREKNRELTRRLHELFANAQENERLSVRIHQLTLGLMRQGSAMDTLSAMAASLAEDFNGDVVRIVLLRPIAGVEPNDWLDVIGPGRAAVRPPAAGEAGCPVRRARRRRAVHGAVLGAGAGDGRRGKPRSQPLLSRHGHAVPAHDGRGLRCGAVEVCRLTPRPRRSRRRHRSRPSSRT